MRPYLATRLHAFFTRQIDELIDRLKTDAVQLCGRNRLMDAKTNIATNIKSRLPSRHVTEGPERAPHRSYLYAMGLTTQQIHQPFVGVASCWNEAAPCNISLMRQAQAVKKGVASA